MDTISAYGKIYALGHRAVKTIFDGPVDVQEKVDGSQFSFAISNDLLLMRSKGASIYPESPDSMFRAGAEYVKTIADRLIDGWTYRGEYLRAPKHNSLAYNRIPLNHIALFDVMTGLQTFSDRKALGAIAKELGIEAVPTFFTGTLTQSDLDGIFKTESFLGGQSIEGIVVKSHNKFDQETGKALMAKYVSEAFKEVHNKEWKKDNPTQADILQQLIERYKTEARWEKAVYRLRDMSLLSNEPKDIGLLMKEVWPDVEAECKDDILETLWKHFSPHLKRGVVSGLPEWYKKRLLHQQFDQEG